MTKIAVVVGSLNPDSKNRKLGEALASLAPEDVEFDFLSVDMPLFNPAFEYDMPEAAAEFKQRIEDADGVLFVTPEYNRSIPGVLKNATDWASRPPGKNAFMGKPAGIVGTSPGALGASQAQSHLRAIVPALGMILMGQPAVYLEYSAGLEEDGTVKPEAQEFLQGYVDALLRHVDMVNA